MHGEAHSEAGTLIPSILESWISYLSFCTLQIPLLFTFYDPDVQMWTVQIATHLYYG